MVRTPSVWRWQLIFMGAFLVIIVIIAGFRPQIFTVHSFLWGCGLVIAVTLVTIIVPWERVAPQYILLVPFIDTVAVGLVNNAPDLRLGFLWVFPVTWVATYYPLRMMFIQIALITVLIATLGTQSGDPIDIVLRVLVTVLTLSFLGTSIQVGTRRSRATQRLLQGQSAQISRTAERAKAHQQRVTQVIDALDTALVAVSEDGTILDMNDAYRRLQGRDRFGLAQPSPAVEYDDFQGEALPPQQTTRWRAARGETLRNERVWLFDAEGRWRVLDATTEPIATVSGELRATLLILHDVTERLDADQKRRTMATIVSHELRNPLTAVLGHVELLLDRDDLPEQVHRQLEVIANSADRMERLVSGVLDDSCQKSELLSEPVDMRALVDASLAAFGPHAVGVGVSIRAEGPESLRVTGDAFRLRQLVDNLLSNALKYTPAGGSVTIGLARTADGRAQLRLEDTGVGMSNEDLSRIFDAYFRSETAIISGVPGTGLGMGIVRDIVTDHGGTIDMDSAPGEGTSVTVHFPPLTTKQEAK